MKKQALLIGVDNYKKKKPLTGCVEEAKKLAEALEYNADDQKTRNFTTEVLDEECDADIAKEHIQTLFAADGEKVMALFYFAGHADREDKGRLLFKDGSILHMQTLLQIACESKVLNKVIILDCCFAGQMGDDPFSDNSQLPPGIVILSACTSTQRAAGKSNGGIFTTLLLSALTGEAADFMGNITCGGIYSYIDKMLGSSNQRPVLKTNIKNFAVIKNIKPRVDIPTIRRITEFFETPDCEYKLDPSYEHWNFPDAPEDKRPAQVKEPYMNSENSAKFRILQNLNKIGFVEPVGTSDMYFAAMDSKSCRLTEQGRQCWNLVTNKII